MVVLLRAWCICDSAGVSEWLEVELMGQGVEPWSRQQIQRPGSRVHFGESFWMDAMTCGKLHLSSCVFQTAVAVPPQSLEKHLFQAAFGSVATSLKNANRQSLRTNITVQEFSGRNYTEDQSRSETLVCCPQKQFPGLWSIGPGESK